MPKTIKRKCHYCNEQIIINNETIDSAVRYGDFNYHKNCFLKQCDKNIHNKRCKQANWQHALDSIDYICETSNTYYDELLKKKKDKPSKLSEEEKNAKNNLDDFLRESYGLLTIPPYFWIKLTNIKKGKDEKVKIKIPFVHFYDMWKRKIGMLNKIYIKNKTNGKDMSAESRLFYDLQVLINKYDSYLLWLNKQKTIETKEDEIKPVVHVDYVDNTKDEEEDIDFSALVDEIFS